MIFSKRQADLAGRIVVACLVFMWLEMLIPNAVKVLLPVFDRIGPFYWSLALAIILLPIMAANRGSKWWLSVTAAGIVTLSAFLRMVWIEPRLWRNPP